MAIPSTQSIEITKLFLFGTTSATNLLSDDRIRPTNEKVAYEIDVNQYMNTVGRFATLDRFEVVQRFFSPTIGADSEIPPGIYTKAEMFSFFGISDSAFDYERRNIVLNQATEGVSDSDFFDRSYIWATTAFRLADTTKFIVGAQGERQIIDWAIEPSLPNGYESFDLKSDTLSSQIANI